MNYCFSVRLLLKNFLKIFKNVKNIEKIHMNSEKIINSFEIKNDKSPDYLWEIFFSNLLITFWHYYAKYIALTSFMWLFFFQISIISRRIRKRDVYTPSASI